METPRTSALYRASSTSLAFSGRTMPITSFTVTRSFLPGCQSPRVDCRLLQVLVGGDCQELDELGRLCHPLEDLPRLLGAPGVPRLVSDALVDRRGLLVEHFTHELARDGRPAVEPCAVADPLPDLRAADLRGGGVLHQRVDRGGSASGQPERDVLEADADVRAKSGLGDVSRSRGQVKQIARGDADVVAAAFQLIGGAFQARFEHFARDRDEVRMSDPGSVVARADLA